MRVYPFILLMTVRAMTRGQQHLWFSNYISIRFTVIDVLQNVNASTGFCCHANSLTSRVTYINFCTASLRAAYSCLSASEVTQTQYPHFIMETTTVGKKGAVLFLGIYGVGNIRLHLTHYLLHFHQRQPFYKKISLRNPSLQLRHTSLQ